MAENGSGGTPSYHLTLVPAEPISEGYFEDWLYEDLKPTPESTRVTKEKDIWSEWLRWKRLSQKMREEHTPVINCFEAMEACLNEMLIKAKEIHQPDPSPGGFDNQPVDKKRFEEFLRVLWNKEEEFLRKHDFMAYVQTFKHKGQISARKAISINMLKWRDYFASREMALRLLNCHLFNLRTSEEMAQPYRDMEKIIQCDLIDWKQSPLEIATELNRKRIFDMHPYNLEQLIRDTKEYLQTWDLVTYPRELKNEILMKIKREFMLNRYELEYISYSEEGWENGRRDFFYADVSEFLCGDFDVSDWLYEFPEFRKPPKNTFIEKIEYIQQKNKELEGEAHKYIKELLEQVSKVKWDTIQLYNCDWFLGVAPSIRGRLIKMEHLPSDMQWLHYGVQVDRFSSGTSKDYKSWTTKLNRCPEEVVLRGAIGGGLCLEHRILISEGDRLQTATIIYVHQLTTDSKEFRRIAISETLKNQWSCSTKVSEESEIQTGSNTLLHNTKARSIALSRWVSLRVLSVFTLPREGQACVQFEGLDGNEYTFEEPMEREFKGGTLPAGKWSLVYPRLTIINHFNLEQVVGCLFYWTRDSIRVELKAMERPVSKYTPMRIDLDYEVSEFERMLSV